jgi:DNA ligase-1
MTSTEGLSALWSPPQPNQAERRALPVARAQPRVVDFELGEFDRRLGPSAVWTLQWAYDGQRVQLVREGGASWLWSVTGELLNDRFAALTAAANDWPDGTVVDGVVAARRQGAHEHAVLIADRLPEPWIDRHAVEAPCLTASNWLEADAWRNRSRAQGASGLRLTPVDSDLRSGTVGTAGAWLWPADPLRIRAVLIHAEAATNFGGRGAYRYTFAVWNRAPRDPPEVVRAVEAIGRGDAPKAEALQLMPVAKTHVNLDESVQRAIAHTLAEHALRRFGPVRVVEPRLVFELGCDGIAINARRKAGIELIRPAVLRLLPQARLDQVDTCVAVRALAVQAPALGTAVAAAR